MTLIELKERRDWIIQRKLEIERDLSAKKKRYIVEGISTPLAERVTLEAEYDELNLELHVLFREISDAKRALKIALKATEGGDIFTATLVSLCEQEGLADLVTEARRIADTALLAKEAA